MIDLPLSCDNLDEFYKRYTIVSLNQSMKEEQKFELQLPDLLYFVKESCHENLHDTLNDLRDMSDKMSPLFVSETLRDFLRNFIREVQTHLAHEENTVFPSIAAGTGKNKAASIHHLVDDHDQMKLSLLEIRRMTSNYSLPMDLDVKGLAFFRKLREMDRIILNHIQIEDHILFPMVLSG
jgi:iron-sulfur cluster repair protein YtfE (RIC family)